MAHTTKMTIVFNKSLNLSKERIAVYAVRAALQFFMSNNEGKAEKIEIVLSSNEAQWFNSPDKQIEIVFVPNASKIQDIAFRAQADYIECYIYTLDGAESEVICLVLGPDDADLIDRAIKHEKNIQTRSRRVDIER